MQSFTSVPFKSEHTHGFVSVSGIAKFSSAGVILEFESKIIGLIPGGIKESRIPIGEILDVKFKKGVFKRGAKIEIRIKSFARLQDVPHENGKLTLKLLADDYERGRDAVAALQKDMDEYSATLPPPHPPLTSLFDESEDETRKLEN